MSDSTSSETLHPAGALGELPLLLVALDGAVPVADKRFAAGADVFIGSNTKNDLVLPHKFELPSYRLLTRGYRLHLAKPFFVQATVWLGGEPVALKGFVRDLIKTHPELAEPVTLASERFLIRYATGMALLGRFGMEFSTDGSDETARS